MKSNFLWLYFLSKRQYSPNFEKRHMTKHGKDKLKKSMKILQNIYTLFMRNATLSKKKLFFPATRFYKKTSSLKKKEKNQNTKECNLRGRCSITDLNQ